MRRVLVALCFLVCAGSAASADRPLSWTGFYTGIHAGYAWGDASVLDTTGGVLPGPFDYKPSGVLAGGHAGYNWQMGSVVVGVEGDIGFMDLSGHGTAPSSDPTKQQDLRLESGLYGTATGRLGFVVGKSLIYGKGGWAYLDATASQTTTKPGYVTNPTKAFNGWVWGGGIEHFLSPGVSVKAEYLHFDFGSQLGDQTSVSDDPIGFKYVNKTDVTADTMKVGISVHY